MIHIEHLKGWDIGKLSFVDEDMWFKSEQKMIKDFETKIEELENQLREERNIPEAPVGYVAVKWEEYKELLIIKGKYEELSKLHEPLIIKYDGFNEKGTTILPCKDIKTNDPIVAPPYRITC